MQQKEQDNVTALVATRRFELDHHRLDAFHVAKDAMVLGVGLSKRLPQGYAKLRDQLERALIGAFTQTSEASARTANDRRARFRAARAEAGEAAAVLEGLQALGLVTAAEAEPVIALLWRLCAMLTRLAGYHR
jgi:four helix bundle protein